MSTVLTVLVFAVMVTSSIEGYLMLVNANAAKLPTVLLLVVWLADLARTRRWPQVHLISILCLLLLASVMLSAALNTETALGTFYVTRWVPFLVLSIALVDLLATRVPPAAAIYGLAAGAVIAGLGALVSFLLLGSPRATGPMEDPNDLAYVLTAVLPLLLIGIRSSPRPWVRHAALLGAVVCLAGAAATVSRGGLFAMAAATAWAASRRLISLRSAALVTVAAVVLGATAYLVAGSTIDRAFTQKQYIAGQNIDTRESRWNAALRGLADNPLFGVGPGGDPYNYSKNSFNAEPTEQTPVTHNMYIEVASELGLLGIILFFGIIAAAFVSTHQVRPRPGPLVLAVQGSMIALCTSSTFLSEEYYMPLWACVATAAAMDLRATRRLNA